MTSTPTPAQRVALAWIASGQVRRYYPWRPGRSEAPSRWRVTKGHGETGAPRADTITRCVEAKWARVGERQSALYSAVELTDAGREALACRS